jgi:hypothetical protein
VYPSQLFSLPSIEQRSGAAIKYAKAEKLVAANNLFPIINKPIFKPSLQTTFHPITTQGNQLITLHLEYLQHFLIDCFLI